ncbi:8180_t:CDS:2 [Ambispora gerdemannii]|uniref:8180_t:CDS:1 n=1 Tax=Ambispora gerdemannii TaxID=144530 RepID=A0A9N9GKR2_9GLOM|nr:8180_t:CDS:2 [Ambispora gerdemannii]
MSRVKFAVQSLVLYLNTRRVENRITAELSAIKKSRRNSSANTELLQKINDLDRNISLMGYEVRDIKNGVGSRDSNSGSRRSGSNRTPQDYTGDIQTLWQVFDRLFKEKRRLEKRTESSMYSKISEEIRELGQRLGDATIRKFHKRLTRNPTDETIEFIRLWVDNERELDTEVEEEENSDSAGPSGTRE